MGKPILNDLFENKNTHIEEVPEIDKKEFIKSKDKNSNNSSI